MLPQKCLKIQGVAGAFWSGFGAYELRARPTVHTRKLTARACELQRARAFIKAAPSAPKTITNARAFMYAHTSVLTTPRLAGGGRYCSGALLCPEFRVVLLATRVATFAQARTGEGGFTCKL